MTKYQVSTIIELVSNTTPSPTIISPSSKAFINPLVLQDRWSREKHIELVNIPGEPQAEVTTRSRIRDSKAASAHECLYVNILSKIEPKKLIEGLEGEGWIISMQEELNQIERNMMDEHGVVVKNKVRLVAQAYMSFVVFQMDVKSDFLNGKISEKVYVQQPPGFKSSEFSNHVYKLDKALYGLK
ncbi:retrovirus-related pol polyprotein from transposon TNT 1-94 [Tanacetum coccineum]